jgi:hypothetical protein
MSDFVAVLIGFAIIAIYVGAVHLLSARVPWVARLPGNVNIESGNWKTSFPLGTSLVISVLLTLIHWLLSQR